MRLISLGPHSLHFLPTCQVDCYALHYFTLLVYSCQRQVRFTLSDLKTNETYEVLLEPSLFVSQGQPASRNRTTVGQHVQFLKLTFIVATRIVYEDQTV